VKVLLGSRKPSSRRFTIRLLLEPRDLWVGIFWNRVKLGDFGDEFLLVYVCLIPCLPLVFSWNIFPGRYDNEGEGTV